MFPLAHEGLPSNPELKSLYEIASFPKVPMPLQDYFEKVMSTLSAHFPVAYSALILHDPMENCLRVEALYGVAREAHPEFCKGSKGTIATTLALQQPMAIHQLSQEPLYQDIIKGTKKTENIRAPLLCIPLVAENAPFGVFNITPLYGVADQFSQDFSFLSVLASLLSPVIRSYQTKREEPQGKGGKSKAKSNVLEDLLAQKLTEVLNRLDPYVESKTKMGLLDDIVAIVEKILIKSALEKVGNVQVAAAELLGINRNTLRKKIKDLRIKLT